MIENKFRYKRAAIKIGSNVLTRKDGSLNIEQMAALVDQVAVLHEAGVEVILISSGAVASGREQIKVVRKLDAVLSRQLYSAVGQATLINRYCDLFARHQIFCGQVLTTKENFGTRLHYLTQKQCMEVMLEHRVVPIVNENDTISVTELMFTDNDELSGLVASMMNMEVLIILSNVDGIFTGNPNHPDSVLIPTIDSRSGDLSQYISTEKSSFGRGGMLTKCHIARKVSEEGITVMIANGTREGILLDLFSREPAMPYTEFIAAEKSPTSVKKWIAHSEDFAKGEIHVNQGACESLMNPSAHSLLNIGVTQVKGDFEKHDIIRLYNHNGEPIGVGRVSCDSNKAKALMGSKGGKPLVHYDYLYLDPTN